MRTDRTSPTASSPAQAARSASSSESVTGEEPATQVGKAVPLKVTRVVHGLDHPWDVQPIGQGRLLITEREGRLSVWKKGKLTDIPLPSGLVWAEGETGLMGLAVDPDFGDNRRFYTCLGHTTPGGHDVRVIAWRLGKPRHVGPHRQDADLRLPHDERTARRLPAPGPRERRPARRHRRRRHRHQPPGQDLARRQDADARPLHRRAVADQPVRQRHATTTQRYVQTYGHRNVQGLAQRSDGTLWSAEHGPDRDDEVNLLVNGGDYGWNPVPGYNESVPMTDQGLPGKQIEAKWSSGFPTVATSGASFVEGSEWGWYDGTLAVAALKAGELLFMKFDANGKLLGVRSPAGDAAVRPPARRHPRPATAAC